MTENNFNKEQMRIVKGINCNKCQNNSKLDYCMFCEQRGDLKDHYKPKKKLVAPFLVRLVGTVSDLTLIPTYKTKEEAMIFCRSSDRYSFHTWPAPGFEPIEVDG
jgi:hypothetical protein